MSMNDANVSFGLFEPKTEYFGGRIRLVTCSETNKAGNGPNQPRPGRFYLYKDIHERLKAMDGGYAFCVKNTLGDVVLFKTVKIQDSPLLKDAKFSRKGFFTVNWNDIFPEMYSRGNPSPKKTKGDGELCQHTDINHYIRMVNETKRGVTLTLILVR